MWDNGNIKSHALCEAGITLFMCEDEHYDLTIRKNDNTFEAVLKLNIGDIKHEQSKISIPTSSAKLVIKSNSLKYDFYIEIPDDRGDDKLFFLGSARSKYLSSEVSSGFTGTMVGLFATGNIKADITDFVIDYVEE